MAYADVPCMSSSASDVVLLNTVATVIRDVTMLQMFMHVYVVANCQYYCCFSVALGT